MNRGTVSINVDYFASWWDKGLRHQTQGIRQEYATQYCGLISILLMVSRAPPEDGVGWTISVAAHSTPASKKS